MKKRFLRPYSYAAIGGSGSGSYVVKPLTYMNRSGSILPELLRTTGSDLSDIILVCDNMDLPPGEIRIKRKGSTAGHNGIKSVMEYAGTGDFPRVYIGVGRPAEGASVIDHVLGTPEGEERDRIMAGVERASAALTDLLTGKEIGSVINEYHRRRDPDQAGLV